MDPSLGFLEADNGRDQLFAVCAHHHSSRAKEESDPRRWRSGGLALAVHRLTFTDSAVNSEEWHNRLQTFSFDAEASLILVK
jgi:hypothetical protein